MNRPFWSLRTFASLDTCETIAPLLSLAADGTASPEETRRLDAHLPGCEGCRAAFSWMQATHMALASRPVAVPPPDLHSRIALAIAASSAAPVSLRPARVFTLRTAYAAAASVTVLGIALSYSLWHTPSEVSVKHSARPNTVASVPSPVVKPRATPKTTARALLASNTGKAIVVKHTLIARKPAPIAVTHIEHIASREVPTKLLVVPPVVITPVRHTPSSPQVASRDIMTTEKHGIEKHSPLPTLKSPAPKLPDTVRVAKIIKEPSRIPLDIQPTKLTPDVRVASTQAAPSKSSNILGSVVAHTEDMKKVALTTIGRSVDYRYQEASSLAQTVSSNDRVPVFGGVYSPR